MKFEVSRDVENRVFSVNIKFKEFGNELTPAEVEVEAFKDYGYPKVNTGGAFEGTEGTALFVLTNKEVELKEGFEITHSVHLDALKEATEAAKIAAAEARCELFEEKVLERIEKAIKAIPMTTSPFLDDYPKPVVY